MPLSPARSRATITWTRTRSQRRARQRHHPAKYLGWVAALLLSLSAIALLLALTVAYVQLVRGLPSIQSLPIWLDGEGAQLRQPTRLYDRRGESVILTLQNPLALGSGYLTLDVIPAPIISATLALNDPDFWQHGGWQFPGEQNPLPIAEQLIQDFLLWQEAPDQSQPLRRGLLAAQATSQFGRRKILEWYLNSAHYGPGIYGIEAAAQVYFGKSARTLDLAEAAFLAAAAEQPAIHPAEAIALTTQRQTEILLEMYSGTWISREQALSASQRSLQLQQPVPIVSLAPAFTDLVLEQISTQLPLERVQRGGLKIVTTLDLDLQSQAQCVLNHQLERLAHAAIDESPVGCEAARLLPTLPFAQQHPNLDASALILDSASGQILALTGEKRPVSGGSHPAGTLLTPYIYLAAFARGLGPASLGWDIPDPAGQYPQLNEAYAGPVRLRIALANDYLQPTAALFEQIGALELDRALDQFGIEADPDSIQALLGQPASLLNLSHALSAFSNQGILAGQKMGTSPAIAAVSIQQVIDADGQRWLDWSHSQQRPVVGSQLAYLINHSLQDEGARWPSFGHPNPLEIGRPAMVKQGQTLDGNDVWTVGAIPQRLVGVWVGQPVDGQTTLQPGYSAAIWHALIQYVGAELPVETWPEPPGIVSMVVCDPSGQLPTIECPQVVTEIFLKDNQPTRPDELYRTRPINRITGLLATVFTPPALVEQRVYLIVPPQAAEWAKNADLPVPPDAYDILSSPPSSPEVQMTAPAHLSQVRGQVEIVGTASGKDFRSYRLLVGAGLNPQRWLQIGEDGSRPVEQGLLGTWDTDGLSGLYVLQLQVVRADQQIETAMIQVSVDAQSPEIRLITPRAGESVAPNADGFLLLQAAAGDDLNLQKVEFEIDGILIGVLHPSSADDPTVSLAWQSTPGEHRLRVIAFDRAGNSQQVEVVFTIR